MLGKKPDASEQRDAIHVAIIPQLAGMKLYPGDRVKVHPTDPRAVRADDGGGEGIVDPFLYGPVHEGETFWLVLHPETVTGMRHHWSHPLFDGEQTEVEPPDEVIQRTADACGKTVSALMADARAYIQHGDWRADNSERYKDADWEAFWPAFNAVEGENVNPEHYAPYSCSC